LGMLNLVTMSDALKVFLQARAALLREREELLARIREIDAALGSMGGQRPSGSTGYRHPPRAKNTMNIQEAISQVTAKKPLRIREIVEAVQKIGYKFTSSNPVNSVGAWLYSAAGKRAFKRADGRFSPAK
jgi:hypothetical protein